MNCPNCDTGNPEAARFCFNCGTKLTLVCPQCAPENPISARFCFDCSHSFAGAKPAGEVYAHVQDSAGAPVHLAQHLIPPELATKLKAARRNQSMQGERRIVTLWSAIASAPRGLANSSTPKNGPGSSTVCSIV
jgi:ribosomal protein L40E